MVNVFTHKRFLGDRKVIYEPEEFFKTRVVESVRQGLYELSSEAKVLLASEGVTKLEKDSITTKYGDMKLEDISWLSKMLIVMEFMHDLSYDEVINITHNGQHLESLLKQAEKYGIDVFMSFQFCSESWRHINVAVRFNGDLMEHRMGDMLINIACDFAPCNGIESETRLQFKGTNSEYDLFIPTSRLTLTVDNSFQMKKFMDDLQKAVENGSIQVTGTKADTYADFEISPQQILIATKDNVDYIVQKLRSSNQGFQVLFWCGLRLGELLALTLDDIDFENATLSIKRSYQKINGEPYISDTKTVNGIRKVYLPQRLVDELHDYTNGLYIKDNKTRIFPISKSNIHNVMHKSCEECGVKRIPIHGLRHSHISLLADMGITEAVIASRVGHKRQGITSHYTHPYEKSEKEVAFKLNELMEAM